MCNSSSCYILFLNCTSTIHVLVLVITCHVTHVVCSYADRSTQLKAPRFPPRNLTPGQWGPGPTPDAAQSGASPSTVARAAQPGFLRARLSPGGGQVDQSRRTVWKSLRQSADAMTGISAAARTPPCGRSRPHCCLHSAACLSKRGYHCVLCARDI